MCIRDSSGAVSDVYSFKVWIDTAWNNDFTIQNEADFSTVDTPWYNKTQTVRATFTKDMDGCKEWIEYLSLIHIWYVFNNELEEIE